MTDNVLRIVKGSGQRRSIFKMSQNHQGSSMSKRNQDGICYQKAERSHSRDHDRCRLFRDCRTKECRASMQEPGAQLGYIALNRRQKSSRALDNRHPTERVNTVPLLVEERDAIVVRSVNESLLT